MTTNISNPQANIKEINDIAQKAQIGGTVGALGTTAGLNSYLFNNVMTDEEKSRTEKATQNYRRLSPVKRGREIATGMLWANPETKELSNSYLEPARENGYLPKVAMTLGGLSGAGIAGGLALRNIRKSNSFSYMGIASAEFSIQI